MAERGVEDDNPFSFMKFVSTKDKPVPRVIGEESISENTDDDDIFSTNSIKLSSSGAEKSREQSTSGSHKGASKKEKQKENPFSFKKFLSSGSSSSNKGISPSLTSSECSAAEASNLRHDQVQVNGRTKDTVINFAGSSSEEITLSDSFPTTTDNKNSLASLDLTKFPNIKANTDNSFHYFRYHESEDGDDSEGALSVINSSAQNVPLALPDFLSDAATINPRQTVLDEADDSMRDSYEELLDRIRTLQDDNDRLRSELNRETQKNQDKNQRIAQLRVDLDKQKQKEAADMAALERAAQQVEENLVTTTKRAVQAETTVTKLKQEIRSLQKQVWTLSAECEAYKSGDSGLSDIRERTKYASDELKSAAVVAEKNLKDLLAGVDKLKLLSQVLSSLEKVKDVTSEMSQDDDTKPS